MAVNLPVGLRARHPGKQSSPHLASLALVQAQAAKMKDTVLRAAKLNCGIRACIYRRVALGVAKRPFVSARCKVCSRATY
jgi:hypothetical protein